MGELEEKLESILGNPQAMAQIMSLAQSLNLGGGGQGGATQDPPQAPPAPPEQGEAAPAQGGDGAPQAQAAPAPPPAASGPPGGGLEGMLGALGGLDVGTLSAAAGLIGQFTGGGDDKRTALLEALRPFVREERYAKLDKAIQIAKLSRLIRSGLDLFRARKEDSHV